MNLHSTSDIIIEIGSMRHQYTTPTKINETEKLDISQNLLHTFMSTNVSDNGITFGHRDKVKKRETFEGYEGDWRKESLSLGITK